MHAQDDQVGELGKVGDASCVCLYAILPQRAAQVSRKDVDVNDRLGTVEGEDKQVHGRVSHVVVEKSGGGRDRRSENVVDGPR